MREPIPLSQIVPDIPWPVPSWSPGREGTAAEVWTYASADAPTFTLTIPGDKTLKYWAGMKVMLTQTTVKYFIITKVAYGAPNTTLTIYGGTDYTLVNAAIDDPCVSIARAPAGFPMDPDKWTVSASYAADYSQATASIVPTYYNVTNISIPIGVWNVRYKVPLRATRNSAGVVAECTLSTGNNNESDSAWTATIGSTATGATAISITGTPVVEGVITLAAKTTYYFNAGCTTSANTTTVYVDGSTRFPLIIKAVCAYL
jgi:hypothetical protein